MSTHHRLPVHAQSFGNRQTANFMEIIKHRRLWPGIACVLGLAIFLLLPGGKARIVRAARMNLCALFGPHHRLTSFSAVITRVARNAGHRQALLPPSARACFGSE